MILVEQQFYFEKEKDGELIQVEIAKNHEKDKVYISIFDGKNFTNIEMSEELMDGIYITLADLLNY
jgi:hypothetical protein